MDLLSPKLFGYRSGILKQNIEKGKREMRTNVVETQSNAYDDLIVSSFPSKAHLIIQLQNKLSYKVIIGSMAQIDCLAHLTC